MMSTLELINTPKSPFFPKWYAPTKKQPKIGQKWEMEAVLTTKKPPKWGLVSAAGLEPATNGLKEYWLLRAISNQEPAFPPESFGQRAKPVSWN
jgi:hypothetical protein